MPAAFFLAAPEELLAPGDVVTLACLVEARALLVEARALFVAVRLLAAARCFATGRFLVAVLFFATGRFLAAVLLFVAGRFFAAALRTGRFFAAALRTGRFVAVALRTGRLAAAALLRAPDCPLPAAVRVEVRLAAFFAGIRTVLRADRFTDFLAADFLLAAILASAREETGCPR